MEMFHWSQKHASLLKRLLIALNLDLKKIEEHSYNL
jgi:hypothetical protein